MSQQKLPDKGRKSQLDTYAKFSGIAFQMIAVIGLGSYGGVKIDELYPDLYPTFTLICSLASVAVAMYLVIKQVGGSSNDKKTND